MERPVGTVRIFLVAIVAAALLGVGAFSFQRRIWETEPVGGLRWTQSPGGAVVESVEAGGAAALAGVRPGDRLVSIDGRAVGSALDAASFPWERRDGPIALELRRDERTVRAVLRPSERRSATESYAFLSVVALAFLLSATMLALRHPPIRGGATYSALAASLFALLTFSHTGRGDLLDWGIYWADVAAGAVAPALLVQLAMSLTRRTSTSRVSVLALAYAAAAAIVAFTVWAVGLGGAERFRDPVRVAEATDRLQVSFLSVAVIGAAVLLARSYQRSSSALQRSQSRWMLWGLGVGLVPFVAVCGVPWALDVQAPDWAQLLASVPMLVVPASFTAALVRYRLHDLDLVLRRGLAEVSAAMCVMAVYAVAKLALQHVLGGVLPLSPSGLRYLSLLVAAVAYPAVREGVKGRVDRAFYRKRYSYRATLLDFGRDLNAETDLPSIAERLERRVCDTLDVPAACVLVRTASGGFEAAGISSRGRRIELSETLRERLERDRYVSLDEGELQAVPWARYLFGMKVKESLRAVLVAAERESPEEPLSSEDRALLSTLSAHAAAAIESARLFREVRQQAEHVERLQARQERILESSAVGLLLMDDDRRILAWNRALEGIYGMPREQALGQRIEEVFPLHMVRRIERERSASSPEEEIRIYRYTLVNRAGERIVVNLSVSPASREQAGEGARVVSLDDVTEREKLEEQVLRQERLASLGLLAAGVAHEVNTPLTGISSYAQLLLDEMEPGDPRREILDKIETQSRRASSIANSLLDLARPERTGFEDLSINDAIRETLGLFEPQVKGRGIRLSTALDLEVPPVRGHKGKLQQVLLNLLLNARDAVGGGGTIEVRTRAAGERVAIEVVDNGVGIAEEDLPRIFDPFFTTKGRGRGTGLGLAIAHGIVEEHDGTMTVESTPGEVTRFRIELPAARSARALA